MTKIMVYGEPMIEAKNPWFGTKFAKRGKYIRKTVQWDDRVKGQAALSKGQIQAIDAFVSYSESDELAGLCPTGKGMKTNECRAEYMRAALDKKVYARAPKVKKPRKWKVIVTAK